MGHGSTSFQVVFVRFHFRPNWPVIRYRMAWLSGKVSPPHSAVRTVKGSTINEDGVPTLVFSSKKQAALEFEDYEEFQGSSDNSNIKSIY